MRRSLVALVLLLILPQQADALVRGGRPSGFVIPTAAVACNITTGTCTGIGGGPSLFTAATCNGIADDAPAFNSFNTWATGTWQASHTGLIELDIPSGKVCEFLSGNVNSNFIGTNIKQFQIVGYGATLGDTSGAHGFFLGGGGAAGVQFNGTASTVRLVTVAAGSSSITVLDTSKCGLWAAGNWALIAGIAPQGDGDPPNPQIYEWLQITSTASCAGTGVITLTAPLTFGYKSTWPLYNAGNAFNSDLGGPATLYQLSASWDTQQAYYGLTIDQPGAQTNSNGRDITFRDASCPSTNCFIPSQNKTWRAINVSAPNTALEFDKIIDTVIMDNVTYRRVIVQSGSSPKVWSCNNCTIGPIGVDGTAGITTFTNSNIADLGVGATSFGNTSSFTASNTAIAAMTTSGSGISQVENRGVWSGATFTVPSNISASAAASCGASCTQFTVSTTAGWFTGYQVVFAGGALTCGLIYQGDWSVTVIDATHITIPTAFVSTCTGPLGNLPMSWAVPKANVMFSSGHGPLGPIFQVDDLSVGANNATVITFSQNGSPISGFPTLPGTSWTLTSHPAPTWSCIGCTGAQNVLDLNSAAASGLPFGAYTSRVVTAANSGSSVKMPTIGALTELDVTVTAACSGASNFLLDAPVFYQTVGAATLNSGWPWVVNAFVASATPRKIFPTTSSGAQGGDTLTTPGANSWMIGIGNPQTTPLYSNVGNCGSASTTITIKTDQGVVP